jgi:nucleoside-diphosphate-sugar epimerase
MRIILTGCTGFVGTHLLPTISARHDVHCLVRNPLRLNGTNGVQIVSADLEDRCFTRRLPARADVIVHLAQGTGAFPEDAQRLYRVNLASTQQLADYGRRAGISRFVLASSGSVYNKSLAPLSESSPRGPTDFYAFTKNASEDLLRCYEQFFGLSLLRLFAPYGPGQRNRLIPTIIDRVRRRDTVTINGSGHPYINPIHVNDLNRVILRAMEGTDSYTVNVAGPEVVNIAQIARIAGEALGVRPVFDQRGDQEPFNLIADTNRMLKLFSFENMKGPRDGIPDMLRPA